MLKWIDEVEEARKNRKDGLKVNNFEDDLLKKNNISKVSVHRDTPITAIKGTLRDRKLSLSFITGIGNIEKTSSPAGEKAATVKEKKPSDKKDT